jgi:hypothetical protein
MAILLSAAGSRVRQAALPVVPSNQRNDLIDCEDRPSQPTVSASYTARHCNISCCRCCRAGILPPPRRLISTCVTRIRPLLPLLLPPYSHDASERANVLFLATCPSYRFPSLFPVVFGDDDLLLLLPPTLPPHPALLPRVVSHRYAADVLLLGAVNRSVFFKLNDHQARQWRMQTLWY